MNRIFFRVGALFAIFLFAHFETVRAGMIQDYFAQKVETPGGYYEGQRRGYATGGGFSARWRSSNDYLVGIEKPHLKAGCGGVDIFYGGFNFVKAEYLVQKLQQMAQNAPAVFLDLAITKMMQDLSNSMKSIDALTEAINGIQLDDCKATKAIIAGKPGEILGDSGEQMANAYNTFAVNGGLAGMYDEAKKMVTGAGGAPPSSDKPGANSQGPLNGCPGDLDFIFLTTGTAILGQIAAKRGYNAQYADLMRGYIGDMQAMLVTNDSGAQTIDHEYIPACQENDPHSIENLATGNVYARPPLDGAGNLLPCYKITDANANIIDWATTQIRAIRDALKAGNDLTMTQKAFIDSVPEPVMYSLISSIRNKTDDIAVIEMGQSVGRMYAYSAMRDFYIIMTATIKDAEGVGKGKSHYSTDQCQVSRLTNVMLTVDAMARNAFDNLTAMHGEYARAIAESNQSWEHSRRYVALKAEADKMAQEMLRN